MSVWVSNPWVAVGVCLTGRRYWRWCVFPFSVLLLIDGEFVSCVGEVLRGFPSVVFVSISFPLDEVLVSFGLFEVVDDTFDFVFWLVVLHNDDVACL